jgi:hypothetical protein
MAPSAEPTPRETEASAITSSRGTTLRSKTWFALISFFISSSIFAKSSGEMRCGNSTS